MAQAWSWSGAASWGPVKGYGKGKAVRAEPYSEVGALPDAKSIKVRPATKRELDAFINDNGVDADGEAKLRALDTKLQAVVLGQGSLEDARDKSAVLVSRIKGLSKMKTGDWICPGCFDVQFARNQVCRKCATPAPPETARLQVEAAPGAIASAAWGAPAWDPWAAAVPWGPAKGKGKTMGVPTEVSEDALPDPKSIKVQPAATRAVDAFLSQNSVDEDGAAKLRALDAKLQAIVMGQGSLEDARDKTAVLASRIKGLSKMKTGDWICSGCFDLQFAKNQECRKCQTAAPPESARIQMLLAPGSIEFSAAASVQSKPASKAEVEQFLGECPVEDHVAAKLRALDPKLQAVVIGQGTMQDARDQTAVLASRITAFKKMKSGDWICSGCFDLQFASRAECRKCGAVAPDESGRVKA
jgi:predicted adenine nucleotide alpha hydrolase (AANH) superfamily ATPase